jgi:hypothetical protein
MKKTAIALFSVSITAGTVYLIYGQVKGQMINNLLESWKAEAQKQNKPIDEAALKKELEEKLYAWDVGLLSSYSKKVVKQEPEEKLKPQMDKIEKRKLLEKADLKSLEGIIFKTKKA